MEPTHIEHPLEPVFDARSRVLVLGTMPSPKSREAGFYYAHPQNRFWKVMGALFGEPEPLGNEARTSFMPVSYTHLLYYSFYETEVDARVKKMWEMHFEQECMHLAMACDLLQKYEGTEWQQIIPAGEFPELLDFHPTKDYVRQVLAEQVTLTAQDEEFVDIDDVPSDFRFFTWNDTVNGRVQDVPSHEAVRQLIERDGEDYRSEDAESPIPELRSRKKDDTKLARVQGYGKKAHEVEKQAKEEREAVLA